MKVVSTMQQEGEALQINRINGQWSKGRASEVVGRKEEHIHLTKKGRSMACPMEKSREKKTWSNSTLSKRVGQKADAEARKEDNRGKDPGAGVEKSHPIDGRSQKKAKPQVCLWVTGGGGY